MNFLKSCRRFRRAAFTLIELLLVVAIISILASLLMPAIGTMQQRADSIKCSSNLRAIGTACQLYLQDHSFIYPCIEPVVTGSGSAVYASTPSLNPYSSMVAAFGQYGITVQTTQCPSDMKQGNASSFVQYGTSYDWRPTLDDENMNQPLIYTRRFFATSGSSGTVIAKLSKVRQAYDDNGGDSGTGIHFGHRNALYADGHVVYYDGPVSAH
jgi:prepilin-type N-terminal cleavage/methylation domain-containing protein/prepilin-type processing-associated H-X9-DG protein